MENKAMKVKQIFVMTIVWAMSASTVCAIEYPSNTQPGQAKVRTEDDKIILENNVLRLVISHKERKLKPATFSNLLTGEELGGPSEEFFHVTVGPDKKTYPCSQFTQERIRIEGPPKSRGLCWERGSCP